MTVIGTGAAVAAGTLGWIAGLPHGLAVAMYVVLQLVSIVPELVGAWRDILVERERTRRHELAWMNAPGLQQAGGDAAAVARGLMSACEPSSTNAVTQPLPTGSLTPAPG